MNRVIKTVSLLCVILTLCFSISGCGKKDYIKEFDSETTTAYEPWKDSFTELYEEEKTTWASSVDAFGEEISDIMASNDVERVFVNNSADKKMTFVLMSYKNSDGNITVTLLKYADSKLSRKDIDTGVKELSGKCDFFVIKDSDYIACRYTDGDGKGVQGVYRFEGARCNVIKKTEYDNADGTEKAMDSELETLLGKKAELISFNEKSVKDDIKGYIKTNLGTEIKSK